MSGNNLTRKDLAEKLQAHIGTLADARRFTSVFFDTLSDAIADADKFKVHNFGVFYCTKKKKRMGRNPKSQKTAVISARRVAGFSASKTLKKRISGHGGGQ